MKKLLKALKEKARNCGVNNKENRARKGAYVDCIVQLEAAINYTHSCETLKDEEEMTFTKWLNKWNWEQIGNSYVFKRGESYTDAESLMKSYKKEYNL